MGERAKIRFFGRVQKVGFRWALCQFAKNTPLTGRVANMRDGTVVLVADGEPEEIKNFVGFCMAHFRPPINCTHYQFEPPPLDWPPFDDFQPAEDDSL